MLLTGPKLWQIRTLWVLKLHQAYVWCVFISLTWNTLWSKLAVYDIKFLAQWYLAFQLNINTGFIGGILRGVRYAKSLRVLFLHRRSSSWTTLVLYSRAVFIFNEPTKILDIGNHLAIPDEETGHSTAEFQVLYKLFHTLWYNPKKELFLDVYVIFIFHAITTDNSGHCPYWQIYSMFSSKIEVTRTGASSSGTALKSQPNFLLTFSSNFSALVWTQKYQLFVSKQTLKKTTTERLAAVPFNSIIERCGAVTFWDGSGSATLTYGSGSCFFVSGWPDAKFFFLIYFCLLLWRGLLPWAYWRLLGSSSRSWRECWDFHTGNCRWILRRNKCC